MLNIYCSTTLKSNPKAIKDLTKILKKHSDLLKDFLLEPKLLKGLNLKNAKNLCFQVDVKICSDQYMKKINLNFRGKDKTTDVLSFPMYENLRKKSSALEKSEISLSPEIFLGDLLISYPVTVKQAKEREHSVSQELLELFIHGFLHLLGFDHEISPKEQKIMFDLEAKILEKIRLG